ncbi:hypothetical protein QO034_13895, partial [Sedimentitalea sp. JM2-8]
SRPFGPTDTPKSPASTAEVPPQVRPGTEIGEAEAVVQTILDMILISFAQFCCECDFHCAVCLS